MRAWRRSGSRHRLMNRGRRTLLNCSVHTLGQKSISWCPICSSRNSPISFGKRNVIAGAIPNSGCGHRRSSSTAFPSFAAAPLIRPAVQIARAYNRSVYDCVYIALAIETNTQMITADEKLANSSAGLPVTWLGLVWLTARDRYGIGRRTTQHSSADQTGEQQRLTRGG